MSPQVLINHFDARSFLLDSICVDFNHSVPYVVLHGGGLRTAITKLFSCEVFPKTSLTERPVILPRVSCTCCGDRLVTQILVESRHSILFSKAALLPSTKWCLWPQCLVAVDPDDACIKLCCNTLASHRVCGHNSVAEAVWRVVRQCDGLLLGLKAGRASCRHKLEKIRQLSIRCACFRSTKENVHAFACRRIGHVEGMQEADTLWYTSWWYMVIGEYLDDILVRVASL